MSQVNQAVMLVLLSLLVSCPLAAAPQKDCYDTAKSQGELTECSKADFIKADAQMNQAYEQLRRRYASDQNEIKPITSAQSAWLSFRDAQVEASFPKSLVNQFGSVFDMCRYIELTRLTKQRIEDLRRMLDRQEGDVCLPLAPGDASR